jgi:hypothetical protein
MSEIRGAFYPLSIVENKFWMGRSLEVRRKSENLPVVGCTLVEEPVSIGAHIIDWILKQGL